MRMVAALLAKLRVALRKESVDRNILYPDSAPTNWASLSARRAWIEILKKETTTMKVKSRSPQGERG